MPAVERFNLFPAVAAFLPTPPAGPTLVAHWKFDEVGGTSAADDTGNGNTGALNGPAWSQGKVGDGALNFDGVNDRMNVPAAGVNAIANNFTLSFWAEPRATHQIDPQGATGTGGVGGQRYVWGPSFYTDGAGAGVSVGTNGVSVYEHAAGYMPATLVYQATLSGWTHIAVVYENRQPRLYINGAHVKTGVTSPKAAVGIIPWGIGGVEYGYFDGQLDDLRLYDGALPSGQIAALADPSGGSTEARGKRYVTWAPAANAADAGNGTLRNAAGGAVNTYAAQTLLRGDGYFESTASHEAQDIRLNGADGATRQIVLGAGGAAQVVENGAVVAATAGAAVQFAPHAAGDRYRLEVAGGVLRYVRYRGAARAVLHTSANALPAYPFRLHAQISNQNTEWQRTVVAQTTQHVTWASVTNAADLGGGTVRKTSPEGWDFSVAAQEKLVKGDGYFESTSSSSNHQSINLYGADGAERALVFGGGGWAGIYENGVNVAATCCMSALIPGHHAGDRYRLEIKDGKLRYVLYRGGVRTLMYTSANPLPAYPLTLTLGASPQNSEWQNSVIAQTTRSAAWSSITNGVDAGGGTVRKTSPEGWDFGAVPHQSILAADGHFESTSSAPNHQSINLYGVDGAERALVFGGGGWAGIYENGVQVAGTCCMPSLIPAHLAGDRYRMEVAGGKLRYVLYRAGVRTLMYTSANPLPAYPLKTTLGASPQNSEWQNSVAGENAPEYNAAAFVSQSVPTTMRPGQTQSVSVVLRNTGTSAWTPDNDYRLGSQNAPDNVTWGPSRVNVTAPVLPGETATFNFNVTAPSTPGVYNFQWRMLQERVEGFGPLTTNVAVTVNNTSPLVSITSPANGATFAALDTITINASASDADGAIAKVEFFADAVKLGEDAVAPYSFTWNNVAGGAYSLTAKATDNLGAVTTSAAVGVNVAHPTVSVSATDGAASEPGADTGVFVFSRTGNTGQALAVNFNAGGTATNGADYATLPASVTIPAGAASQTITVTPLDDFSPEGAEVVTLSLTAGAGYVVGAANNATVTIHDNDTRPTVSITSPAGGAVFHAPATVTITANASDADPGGSVGKVEFFRNGVKLGEDTAAPYSYVWSNATVGASTLTAVATDNVNVTGASSPVSITVNAPPTVSITAPAGGSVFTTPANITINASAADPDAGGSVAKVEFFQGATKLGEDTTAPYSFVWSSPPAGVYSLTARATDNAGAAVTSGAVAVTVNAPPTVDITSPSGGAVFNAPANITISAAASDAGGSVSKVEFFRGATKLGEDTAAPYAFDWANVAAGAYSLTARATDEAGATTTSAAVNVTVTNAPAVQLTSPANNATFGEGANVMLSADASDADGSVAKVEFFQGATKLGEDATAPYSFVWNDMPAGSHSLTAVATDNAGATGASSPVVLNVNAPGGEYALSLDGVNSYVVAPNSPTLNLSGPLTVEAWIKTNSTATQGIVEKYNWLASDDGGYALRIEQGRLRFYTIRNSGSSDFVEGATAVSVGVWHHVAGVFDGSQLRVYLDGRADGVKASTVAPAPGTQSLKIGARGNDAGSCFNGLIDEVRVSRGVEYASDFTARSIRDVASAFEDPNDGQMGVWLFDGDADDAADNDNDGTFVGGSLLSNDTFGASNVKYENMMAGTSAEKQVFIGFDGLAGQKVFDQYPDARFYGSFDAFGIEYFTYATTLLPHFGEARPRLTRVTQGWINESQFATEAPALGRFRNFTIKFPSPASNIKFEGIGVHAQNTLLTPCHVAGQLYIQRVNEPDINLNLCGRINEQGNVELLDRPKLYDLNRNGIKNVKQMDFHTITDIGGLDFDSFQFTVAAPTPTPEVKTVTYETVNSPVDDNPAFLGGGKRIFPDKATPNDTRDMSLVRVKATTTYPQGTTIYFRSFDPDDPSSNVGPVDANGASGDDNRGFPARGPLNTAAAAQTDANGTAVITTFTGIQPGDNYIFAASADLNYLNGVNVNGSSLRDSAGATLPTLRGKPGPLLTVWRTLHVELDGMEPVRDNKVIGTVAGGPVAALDDTGAPAVPSGELCIEEQVLADRFQGGTIVIGTNRYWITGNTEHCFTVAGHFINETPAGTKVTLYDDDDLGNNDNDGAHTALDGDEGEAVPLPDTSLAQNSDDPAKNLFAYAYVRPKYDIGDPTDNRVPFLVNIAEPSAEARRAVFDFDQVATEASPNFWTAYALGAYQYSVLSDADPDVHPFHAVLPPVGGIIDGEIGNSKGLLMFAETLREWQFNPSFNVPSRPFTTPPLVFVHELGHLFDGRHEDKGLMGAEADRFSDITIDKIRNKFHP